MIYFHIQSFYSIFVVTLATQRLLFWIVDVYLL